MANGPARPPRSPRSNVSSFFRGCPTEVSSLHGVRRYRHPAVPQRLPEQLLLRAEQAVRVHDDGPAGHRTRLPRLLPLVEGEEVGLCVDPASPTRHRRRCEPAGGRPGPGRNGCVEAGLRLSGIAIIGTVESTPLLQLYRALAAPTPRLDDRTVGPLSDTRSPHSRLRRARRTSPNPRTLPKGAA